jgi:hypothetical protein
MYNSCAQVSDVAMVRTTLRIRMARRMPEFITGNEIRDVRAAARLSQPKFAALAEVSTRTICLTFRRIARAMLKAAPQPPAETLPKRISTL